MHRITIHTFEGKTLDFQPSSQVRLYRKAKQVDAKDVVVGDTIEYDGVPLLVTEVEEK